MHFFLGVLRVNSRSLVCIQCARQFTCTMHTFNRIRCQMIEPAALLMYIVFAATTDAAFSCVKCMGTCLNSAGGTGQYCK